MPAHSRHGYVELRALWLAGLASLSGLEVAEAQTTHHTHSTLEEMVRTGNSLAAPRGCPSRHVEWLDGRCEASWSLDPVGFDYYYFYKPRALKPASRGRAVEPLCQIDPAMIDRLQRLAVELPADAWNKPQAKFSAGNKLEYDQAVFHFPMNRTEFLGRYSIFKYASWVHDWIEPFLLNITRRYNYTEEPVPQSEGYLLTSIPRLFLARLFPQQKQMTHVDTGGSSVGPHKIHVPLVGESQSVLMIKSRAKGGFTPYSMPVGFAYEVNNQVAHYAENQGTEPRIHLIFEYLPLDIGSNRTDAIAPTDRPEIQQLKARQAAAAAKEL